MFFLLFIYRFLNIFDIQRILLYFDEFLSSLHIFRWVFVLWVFVRWVLFLSPVITMDMSVAQTCLVWRARRPCSLTGLMKIPWVSLTLTHTHVEGVWGGVVRDALWSHPPYTLTTSTLLSGSSKTLSTTLSREPSPPPPFCRNIHN